MGTLGERMAMQLSTLGWQQISLDALYLQNQFLMKLNTSLIPWGQLLFLFSQSATTCPLQVEIDSERERKSWENFKRLWILCGKIPVIPPKQEYKVLALVTFSSCYPFDSTITFFFQWPSWLSIQILRGCYVLHMSTIFLKVHFKKRSKCKDHHTRLFVAMSQKVVREEVAREWWSQQDDS